MGMKIQKNDKKPYCTPHIQVMWGVFCYRFCRVYVRGNEALLMPDRIEALRVNGQKLSDEIRVQGSKQDKVTGVSLISIIG